MAESHRALAEALRDRYELERELGRGGMATVWLARDLKHERPVALKVLRPELGALLGADRFLREIRLTANLQHPHILALLDSGDAAGHLWYTMPYVEGESLRMRLSRERQLPLEDALRFTREVADALGHAHARGIVHRDIKPENILLDGDHALVADFGIARVLADGGERLTETGLVVGTPAYMSPEQATGEARVDARTDVYSLACVLYEMLAGEPPHTGPTAQAILTKRLTDPVLPVARLRDHIPPQVDPAIRKALARTPADRFATPADFVAALTALEPTTVATAAARRPASARRVRLSMVAFGALALAATGIAYAWRHREGTVPPRAAADELAIFPFRVAGSDPALHYLREGMVDLLGAKLTGEGGLRAADSRAVIRRWRRAGGAADADLDESAMLGVARELSAGRILVGSVVGTPARVFLQARMLDVTGRPAAEASAEAPAESLPALVDRLTAQLLARGAGQVEQRLSDFTSTSLPALRAYLEGQAAYRAGRYAAASEAYGRALELDSSFALAALGVAATDLWLGTVSHRARALAWAGRSRLSPRDRALAIAYAGTRFPQPTPFSEDLAGWVRAVEVAPDRPEAWFYAGDRYFHFGALLGLAGADRLAESYFRRALELEPGSEAPLVHLIELAALRGDTTEADRLASRFLAADSAGDVAGYIRWRVAVARNHQSVLDSIRAELARMPVGSLVRIIQTSQDEGIALEDADRAAAVLQTRAVPPAERRQVLFTLASHALNRGRSRLHVDLTEALHQFDPAARTYLRLRVAGAVYADADPTVADSAARMLTATAYGPIPADSSARLEQLSDLCVVALWRAQRGQPPMADNALARLQQAGSAGCAAVIAAVAASSRGTPDAGAALFRLDSLLLAGVGDDVGANLIAARLHAKQGNLQQALAAVRRRGRWATVPSNYVSAYVREEGRLAALTGDTAGAIRAYRHYLALRSAPEPSRRADADSARAALHRLTAEPGQP